MIRVLLADDNKMSLQYFSKLIQWEDYGYKLVSTAVDGENAWYDFQTYMPEVVIADIQMPVLSGIDLAKKVLSTTPDTVFLFLSSYKEFQYARAALQLKVYDYLLKHETTKEILIQKLEEIRTYLAQEKKKRRLFANEEISSLFLHRKENICRIEDSTSFLTGEYDCFILEEEHHFPFFIQKLQAYFPEETLPDKKILLEFCSTMEYVVGIVAASEVQFVLITTPSDNPFDFCCRLQRKLWKQFSCSYSLVMLQKRQSIQKCALAYEQNRVYLTQLYFYPSPTIIEGTYLLPQNPVLPIPEEGGQFTTIYEGILADMDRLYEAIAASKDFAAFCRTAEKWLDLLLNYDKRVVHPSTGRIVSLFAGEVSWPGCDVNAVYQWIRSKFTFLTDILALSHYREYSSFVREATYLISIHFSNCNLSVEWIADKICSFPYK